MVRVIVAAVVMLFLALPALAQDDFPRFEMSLGYGNIGFPCCKNFDGALERHSGFASTQSLNLTRIVGLENYFGYYSLGNRVSLIANMFGGKFAARSVSERATPYFVAGIGVGYMTDEQTFGQSSFATRFGPGVDVKFNESMALKFDFTRMSFHLGQITADGGTWHSGWNFSTGVVFILGQ
jgi:hypothetical protein